MSRLFTIVLLVTFNSLLQVEAQSVVNSSGWSSKISQFSFESSLGEPATISLGARTGVVFQGVLQPRLPIITSRLEPIYADVKIYPNPFINELNIESINSTYEQVAVKNIHGQVVHEQQFNNNTSLRLSYIPSAIYVLVFYDKNEKIVLTRRILKL